MKACLLFGGVLLTNRAIYACDLNLGGTWGVARNESYAIRAYRPTFGETLFCPAESKRFSCYYQNKTDRAKALDERLYNFNDQSCRFKPLKFLELLRNRKLFIVGDSISGQIFSAFFCLFA